MFSIRINNELSINALSLVDILDVDFGGEATPYFAELAARANRIDFRTGPHPSTAAILFHADDFNSASFNNPNIRIDFAAPPYTALDGNGIPQVSPYYQPLAPITGWRIIRIEYVYGKYVLATFADERYNYLYTHQDEVSTSENIIKDIAITDLDAEELAAIPGGEAGLYGKKETTTYYGWTDNDQNWDNIVANYSPLAATTDYHKLKGVVPSDPLILDPTGATSYPDDGFFNLKPSNVAQANTKQDPSPASDLMTAWSVMRENCHTFAPFPGDNWKVHAIAWGFKHTNLDPDTDETLLLKLGWSQASINAGDIFDATSADTLISRDWGSHNAYQRFPLPQRIAVGFVTHGHSYQDSPAANYTNELYQWVEFEVAPLMEKAFGSLTTLEDIGSISDHDWEALDDEEKQTVYQALGIDPTEDPIRRFFYPLNHIAAAPETHPTPEAVAAETVDYEDRTRESIYREKYAEYYAIQRLNLLLAPASTEVHAGFIHVPMVASVKCITYYQNCANRNADHYGSACTRVEYSHHTEDLEPYHFDGGSGNDGKSTGVVIGLARITEVADAAGWAGSDAPDTMTMPAGKAHLYVLDDAALAEGADFAGAIKLAEPPEGLAGDDLTEWEAVWKPEVYNADGSTELYVGALVDVFAYKFGSDSKAASVEPGGGWGSGGGGGFGGGGGAVAGGGSEAEPDKEIKVGAGSKTVYLARYHRNIDELKARPNFDEKKILAVEEGNAESDGIKWFGEECP